MGADGVVNVVAHVLTAASLNGMAGFTDAPRIAPSMSEYDDVRVLLPTYDEVETVETVVSSFRDVGLRDVLVIDGGSTDGTREAARDAGARVVRQSGEGKGQAIREAVRDHVDTPYVLMADADATYDAADADAMLEPIRSGDAEHVIGNRFADMRPGAMTRLNRVGNRLINRSFRLIHGEDYGDILSGYRAFTRESFRRLHLSADGFGIETEMAVECAKNRVDVAVVPITYRPRPGGSSTNLHPIRDGGVIFLELYRKAKTNNPLFYFGSVGATATAAGAVMAAYVLYRWLVHGVGHEIIAVGAAGATILGIQLLVFGFLADMILSLHREQLARHDRAIDAAGDDGPGDAAGEDDAVDAAGEDDAVDNAGEGDAADEVGDER